MKILIVLPLLFILLGCVQNIEPRIKWDIPEDKKKQYIKELHECIKSREHETEYEWRHAREFCEPIVGEKFGDPIKGFIYVGGGFNRGDKTHFIPCDRAVTEEQKKVCGCTERDDDNKIIYSIEE